MTTTPAKPMRIAIQRRQPTGSRSASAAPIVTASGSDCSTAEMLASGMCPSATRKKPVPPSSKKLRVSTSGLSARRGLRSAPCCQASRPTNRVANTPRTNMIWPAFICDDRLLVIASLHVKVAIARTMNSAARRLGEVAMMLPASRISKAELYGPSRLLAIGPTMGLYLPPSARG